MIWAILAALGCGFLNAVSGVMQRQAAVEAPPGSLLSWQLIDFLVRNKRWLAGVALSAAAFALQALALVAGQLSLVEPLLTTELPFLLLILLIYFHEPIGLREWLGGGAIAAGLGLLLALSDPHGGRVTEAGLSWTITFAATGAFILLAIWLTLRNQNPVFRAAVMGSAAGAGFGLTAALVKLAILQLHYGFGAFMASWPPYALLVAGVASLLLAQNVFRAGPLAASQPALMIVDPAVSIAIGVLIFNDQLRHSPLDLTGISVASVVLVTGIVLLGGSPVIQRQRALSI